MDAYIWIVPALGLTGLVVFLFLALHRWTAGKQQQMGAEEFRLWFQKNYLGVTANQEDIPTKSNTEPGNSRKARLDRSKP